MISVYIGQGRFKKYEENNDERKWEYSCVICWFKKIKTVIWGNLISSHTISILFVLFILFYTLQWWRMKKKGTKEYDMKVNILWKYYLIRIIPIFPLDFTVPEWIIVSTTKTSPGMN